MAAEDLPSEFDVVVLGTGVTEAIVAAACSRVGKSVLHLDRNSYYGSQTSTFTFTALKEFFAEYSSKKCHELNDDNANFVSFIDKSVTNVVVKSNIPETSDDNAINEQSEKILTETETVIAENEIAEKNMTEDHTINSTKSDVSDSPKSHLSADSIQCNTSDFDSEKSNDTDCKDASVLEDKKVVSSGKVEQAPVKTMTSTYQTTLAIQAKLKDPESKNISIEDFAKLNRKFNLDISPNFLFSAGKLVKSIIKANISHYAEFKLVDRILMLRNEKIEEVPCNRSDVFSSTFLTMIEKRTLMKFLNFCISDTNEEDIDEEESFKSFLTKRRLSDNLQSFITYSIAMVKPETKTKKALLATRSFLSSIGHYGKTPFLWPLYGCGEIPQMFCRMSAVFAGLYCLDKKPNSVNFENADGKITLHVDNKDITCKHLVLDNTYLHSKYIDYENSLTVSKVILIVNKSLVPTTEEHLSFLTIPPLEGKNEPVQVIEVGPASAACPSGLFVLYLTTKKVENAYNDLNAYVQLLVDDYGSSNTSKPWLYWSIYFNHTCFIANNNMPVNTHVGVSPCVSLGFSNAVTRAEEIFNCICPDAEFLEKVPNAEDIIWDHEDSKEVSEQDDSRKSDEKTDSKDVSEKDEMLLPLNTDEKETDSCETDVKSQEENEN